MRTNRSLFVSSILTLALSLLLTTSVKAQSEKKLALAELVSNTGGTVRKVDDGVFVLSIASKSKKVVEVIVGHRDDYLIFVVELANGTDYKMSLELAESLLKFQSKLDWVRVELSDKGDLQLFIHDTWSHTNQKGFDERLGQMVAATEMVTKILERHLTPKKAT